MDYKEIIADSWHYTQKSKRLIFWFGFLPALLTTAVTIIYILYLVFAFKNSSLFGGSEDGSFLADVAVVVWDFLMSHKNLLLPLIISSIVLTIFYFLFPTMAMAASIQVIARERNGHKTSLGEGFRRGIMRFLQLFEYHLMIKMFAFFTIIVDMLLVLRTLGPDFFKLLLPVFLLFMVIGLILTLFFTYTDFYIVIDGEGVFASIKRSSALVLLHLKHTFLISLLMLIIGIRVVFQAIMVFLIPTLIILISGYIMTVALPITGLIVGGIVGLIALVVAAYLTGIVDIFSYTVWTYTFLTLSSEKEIDVREAFVDDIGENH